MQTNKIVTIGEVLWDILPSGKKLGGAPANFTYYAQSLGAESILISAIGNDTEGIELQNLLKSKNITTILTKTDLPTGNVIVDIDKNGQPQYTITDQVAWDCITLTEDIKQIANHTKAFCFGTLAQRHTTTKNTIFQFINLIPPENNALIIFDINLRQTFWNKETIEHSLKVCNILKMNENEAEIVFQLFEINDSSPSEACRKLIALFDIKIIIITLGEKGSVIYTNTTSHHQNAKQVEIKDTIGAGDAFTAAFIVSVLQGKNTIEAQQIATSLSAEICTKDGAI